MNQEGKSTPKMRRAYTPRVKSAQNIHNMEPKKALYFTDKKDQHNPPINPERIERHLAKKLNINPTPEKIGKFDIAYLNTNADSPIKKNNFFSNPPKNTKPQNQNLKVPYAGRNLQWPVNDKKIVNGYPVLQKKEQKLSRCMSAHTMKSTFLQKSQKSNKIKQSRRQLQDKFEVAFDYLLSSNTEYLNQKLSMCNQKVRPKEQIFTIKRPSLVTTNKDFYKKNQDKHKIDIEPQNQKMSILMSQSKVCGNSTAQQFHKGTHGQKANLAEWSEGFKLQGPIYQVTANSNAYPNHGDFNKMVPIAVWNQHPLGMKHRAVSTNSRLLKGQFKPRAQLATWNNLNPIANDLFNPKKGSHYEKQFGIKQWQPIQVWPMAQHKLIVTSGKFNTEMKTSMTDFNNHEINYQNKCNCGRKRH